MVSVMKAPSMSSNTVVCPTRDVDDSDAVLFFGDDANGIAH